MHLDMKNLVRLQELDTEILKLEKFVSVSPDDLLQKEAKLEKLLSSLSILDSQLEEANSELVQVRVDLESSQSLFDGAEVKKGNVHNSKEYEAALKEIDSLSTTMATLDTRKGELEGIIKTLTEELSGFDAEKETLKGEVDKARTAYEDGVTSSKNKLSKTQKERDDFVACIPKPILSKYNRLRKTFSTVVVPLDGEYCSGCSIQLTPQSVVEVRRGSSVTKCLSCGCYLYHKPEESK